MPKDAVVEARIADYHNARLAMGRINKAAARNLYDWMIVGQAMVDAQDETFEILQTNRTDTKQYRTEFGGILQREKLHEDNGGPDKTTRAQLLKIMAGSAEVLAWFNELPKSDRRRWNHPDSVWRHFESAHKPSPEIKPEKSSPTTGLTADEEVEEVESAQVRALQKRDTTIEGLRDSNRELRAEINRLRAEVVALREIIGHAFRSLGHQCSKLPTDEEIARIVEGGK